MGTGDISDSVPGGDWSDFPQGQRRGDVRRRGDRHWRLAVRLLIWIALPGLVLAAYKLLF